MAEKFAAAINCIDGRVQQAVRNFIMTNFGVDYVDKITEAGADKVLAETTDPVAIEAIRKRLAFSVNGHNVKDVFIVGHFNCLANPVDEQAHKEQILKAIEVVKSWKLPVENIRGIWVRQGLQTCSLVMP
jgi:carbonic anhydrase